jgi:hypothetical protein
LVQAFAQRADIANGRKAPASANKKARRTQIRKIPQLLALAFKCALEIALSQIK